MKLLNFSATRPHGAAAILGCLLLLAACGKDSGKTGTDTMTSSQAGSGERDSGTEVGANRCGDGVKAGDEECDDGNTADGDDCDSHCKHAAAASCGDGQVDDNEECDDGNQDDQDECSNACLKKVCGNKRVEPGEECDDGNQANEDGCTNKCQVVACGDGKKQPSEECDDGNTSSDDGCSSTCKTERCGDGIKQSKEECDEPGTFTCDMATCKAKADTCTPCERKHCSNYMDMDMDLPKGCYDNMPNPRDVPMQPSEGAFSGPCKKLVACVREEMCLGPESHGYAIDDCYCRRDEIDPGKHFAECDANGPDKCKAEFYAASGTMSPMSASVRHQNPETPAGYAFYLLECDREFCKDECAPWLK